MRADVLCVGHASWDQTLFLDEFPKENSKQEIRDLVQSGGGPAANAAALLAGWGVSTAFLGRLGSDDYGARAREELRIRGVDCSLSPSDGLIPFSVILVCPKNGTRTIINRKNASPPLRLPATSWERAPQFLLFDGHEIEAALDAIARFAGAHAVLDGGSVRPGIEKLAEKVQDLVVSERFAAQFTGMPDLRSSGRSREAVGMMRRRFANRVVITLGEAGMAGEDDHGFFEFPAFPSRVVDTTAAGDIFHGAFVFGLMQKMEWRAALQWASLTAAISVASPGGRDSIPALECVNRRWNETRSV